MNSISLINFFFREYNSRCTKLVTCSGNNTNPVWNQVFRFTNLTDNDLNKLHLEITIWNCNEYSDEQYKIGEVQKCIISK